MFFCIIFISFGNKKYYKPKTFLVLSKESGIQEIQRILQESDSDEALFGDDEQNEVIPHFVDEETDSDYNSSHEENESWEFCKSRNFRPRKYVIIIFFNSLSFEPNK